MSFSLFFIIAFLPVVLGLLMFLVNGIILPFVGRYQSNHDHDGDADATTGPQQQQAGQHLGVVLRGEQEQCTAARPALFTKIPKEARFQIMKHYFESRSRPYEKKKQIHDCCHDTSTSRPPLSRQGQGKDSIMIRGEGRRHHDGDVHHATETTEENLSVPAGSDADNDDETEYSSSCPICLNDYEQGEEVLSGTKCNHEFHRTCILQWVEKDNYHCPYCREALLSDEEFLRAITFHLGLIPMRRIRTRRTMTTIVSNNLDKQADRSTLAASREICPIADSV